MTDLIVGICTFRRPSVIETIKSVDAQTGRRADWIIVVDNDDMPTAQQSVEALSLKTPITYIHAPGRNISIARNACLEAAGPCHFAFLDDDETASPEWLTAMVDAMTQGHQAVFGPVIALYPEDSPPWMEQVSPHSQYPLPALKELVTGYTGNCLMDLTHPAFAGRRFDENFGRRHGSDDVYFSAAHRAGASFGRAEAAFVYEPVLPERLSFQWLLKRRYHYGQAHACISQRTRGWLATSAAAKATYCAGAAALSVFSPTQYRKALLRGALHLGVMAGALGTPAEEVYGTS